MGDPGAIPFEAQTLLDVNYAVGRLAFDDQAGYARYVESLIAYETGPTAPTGREVVYWARATSTTRKDSPNPSGGSLLFPHPSQFR